ncbi:MAG: radical SAM protein, partial [Clostridia bacterium]|nr:radical SAM protein [Clostridia bacterium]
MGYKIFDAHAHVYPDKIADRAVRAIGDFYDIPIQKNGTVEGLIEAWTKDGVRLASKCLIHATATTPHQVQSINNFISSNVKNYDCFVGFGTRHTGLSEDDLDAEVERMIAIG